MIIGVRIGQMITIGFNPVRGDVFAILADATAMLTSLISVPADLIE